MTNGERVVDGDDAEVAGPTRTPNVTTCSGGVG